MTGALGLRWVSAQSLGPVTYLLFNGADFLGLFEEDAACIPGGDDREDGKDRGGYGGELGREDERHGGKATGRSVAPVRVIRANVGLSGGPICRSSRVVVRSAGLVLVRVDVWVAWFAGRDLDLVRGWSAACAVFAGQVEDAMAVG